VTAPTLRLHVAAVSDVGRVRKDNQDSGYAGPWLLAICDGVGGAVRGDLASSTAISQIRRLDEPPPAEHTDDDLLSLVAGALVKAHDSIADLVRHDSGLQGTSTTATVTYFDGTKLAVGHVGDSRAYLFRDGGAQQITRDHTFVQTLIDEGRISEEEARVHPHKNLILKALDGARDVEPDLFVVDLQPGDRLMLCSDGVNAGLTDGRIADVLGTGSADYAAVEMVRAALEGGSTDNITCLVADVVALVEGETVVEEEALLVGAASELRRRLPFQAIPRFLGHRMGDTGELEPITDDLADLPPGAIVNDLPDDETLRYALRAPRRFGALRVALVVCAALGLLWIAGAGAWHWSQQQYYIGELDGKVAIYRGVSTSLLGIDLSTPVETTDIDVANLAEVYQETVRDGVHQDSLADAEAVIRSWSGGGEATP
jgi:PPM family protein phosphatase